MRDRLESTGAFVLEAAPLADPGEIAGAHSSAYVNDFLKGKLDPQVMRRIGFPWSEDLVRRTLASVGGTLSATMRALSGGWGGTLAGGTHHAFREAGAGFCVFNDIAIAVLRARMHGVKRVAVLDLDVHQGDGTARMLENDSGALTISVHGANNFPFRKQRSKIDVALPDGTGDGDYLDTVSELVPKMVAWKPEIVFYQSGVDALASDRLGRLSLTLAGLAERDKRVFAACRDAGLPTVVTLGGGYSEPIELTVEAHVTTFLNALKLLSYTRAR